MADITITIKAGFDPTDLDENGTYETRFETDVTLSEDVPADMDIKEVVVEALTGFLARINAPAPVVHDSEEEIDD